MTKLQRQVLEFHRTFDHPVADSPTVPPENRVRFRLNFVFEEAFEMLEAAVDPHSSLRPDMANLRTDLKNIIENARIKVDMPLFVDALADIDYVVEGARLEFGVNGEPIADEVHRSNMAKVGATKTPEGKTLKPPGWTPPDIAGELAKQRSRTGPDEFTMAVRNSLQLTSHEIRQLERLDWAYGNLAIDKSVSRSAFKILATTTVDEGLGLSVEAFDAWAADKKWDAP